MAAGVTYPEENLGVPKLIYRLINLGVNFHTRNLMILSLVDHF